MLREFLWLLLCALALAGLLTFCAVMGSNVAHADERLWATPIDPSTGSPAPWTSGPVKITHEGGCIQITANPNNMSRLTYSEDPQDLGMGPELDPGVTHCRRFEPGTLWLRAPWTTGWAASVLKVAECPKVTPAPTLGSNSKAGVRKLIPSDGSAVIVGGAIGQKVLRVVRPKSEPSTNSTVKVYGSTHIVQRDSSGALCSGGLGCFPDLTTQGQWELLPGVADVRENFNGTYWVWAPGGYDAAAKGKQYVDHSKEGISQSYGPAPVEVP